MWPKLNSLEQLQALKGKSFAHMPFVSFDTATWRRQPGDVLLSIRRSRLGPFLVVRSCAYQEDEATREPPGFFESILDVPSEDEQAVSTAIDRVIYSYRRRLEGDQQHKVIVQTQLKQVSICGVARLHSADCPYLEVDYDDETGRTDAVTAGAKSKRAYVALFDLPSEAAWSELGQAALEIAKLYDTAFFFEFAIDLSARVYVFQVRKDRRENLEVRRFSAWTEYYAEISQAKEVLQSTGPLSVMADWNPIEMLGARPAQLDRSLYERLITRGAWVEGREGIGWRGTRDRSLMKAINDVPYVKLRASLESLLPAGLTDDLAVRIVDDRLVLLQEQPDLHDKVEFRVVWSALPVDLLSFGSALLARGFDDQEVSNLQEALRVVTHSSLANSRKWREADLLLANELEFTRSKLTSVVGDETPVTVGDAVADALDVAVQCGTVPFARQARLAFTYRYILRQLLPSRQEDLHLASTWFASMRTITRSLSDDLELLSTGMLSRMEFNGRYGHLRPGSYNLESPRYDEVESLPTAGARPGHRLIQTNTANVPRLSGEVFDYFDRVGVAIDEGMFLTECEEAFKAREELKFRFTAILSDVLSLLALVARRTDISRSELRNLPINEILSCLQGANGWSGAERSLRHYLRSYGGRARPQLVLPDIMFSADNLRVVRRLEAQPTFVGAGCVEGEVVVLSNAVNETQSVAGKIIAIRSADPGFDWVYSQQIAGLVTEYGGEFSHMALRCSEFGVAAAIGCGTGIFEECIGFDRIKLDANNSEIWGAEKRVYPR